MELEKNNLQLIILKKIDSPLTGGFILSIHIYIKKGGYKKHERNRN